MLFALIVFLATFVSPLLALTIEGVSSDQLYTITDADQKIREPTAITRDCPYGLIKAGFSYNYILFMNDQNATIPTPPLMDVETDPEVLNSYDFTDIHFNMTISWPMTSEMCIGDTLHQVTMKDGDVYELLIHYNGTSYRDKAQHFDFTLVMVDGSVHQAPLEFSLTRAKPINNYRMAASISHYNDLTIPTDYYKLTLDGPKQQTLGYGDISRRVNVRAQPPVNLDQVGIMIYPLQPNAMDGLMMDSEDLETGLVTYHVDVGLLMHYCYSAVSYRAPSSRVDFCVHRRRAAPDGTKLVRGLKVSVDLHNKIQPHNIGTPLITTLQRSWTYSVAGSNPLDLYHGDVLTLVCRSDVRCTKPPCHPQTVKIMPLVNDADFTVTFAVSEYHIEDKHKGLPSTHHGVIMSPATALEPGATTQILYEDTPSATSPRQDWGTTTLSVDITVLDVDGTIPTWEELTIIITLFIVVVIGCIGCNWAFIVKLNPIEVLGTAYHAASARLRRSKRPVQEHCDHPADRPDAMGVDSMFSPSAAISMGDGLDVNMGDRDFTPPTPSLRDDAPLLGALDTSFTSEFDSYFR